MTPLNDARTHLRKAKEFLAAAGSNADLGLYNAAASSAVTSGINSKDAICLALTGTTAKTENHSDAVKELKSAGPSTAALATTLGRLLKLKNRSQYDAADITSAQALKSIEWAARLLDGATAAVNA